MVNPKQTSGLILSQHYWALHDTDISKNLRPFSAFLEERRQRDAEFVSKSDLYTSIIGLLKQMKAPSSAHNDYASDSLTKLLFHAGPDYHDYGAAFAESCLARGGIIEHTYRCNLCVLDMGPEIRGSRYMCLDCADSDFCANCYASWEKVDGEMEKCKGHTFYKLPRPCWYHFEDGVVMEDGSTLPQVIDYLEKRFTMLLEGERT